MDVKLALLSVWGKAGKAGKAGKGVVLVTERDVKIFQTCKTSHFGHFGLARTACHCQKVAVAAAGDATNLLETDSNTVIPLDRLLPILMLNHVPTMTHHEDPCTTLKHIETRGMMNHDESSRACRSLGAGSSTQAAHNRGFSAMRHG